MDNEPQFQFVEQAKESAYAEMPRLQRLGEALTDHGSDMALALVELIVGLLLVRWIDKYLRVGLRRLMPNARYITLACNIIYITLVALVATTAMVQLGAKPVNLIRLITIIILVVTGLLIFFRPFVPTMPFKVGNTIKAGGQLGKVEAITFLNTRLKSFDGKTLFIPNRQILNDIVINYHFFGTRRIKLNVDIRYDQDLLKAKQVLEAIMTEDPRVLPKPGPMVYVLNLTKDSVQVGGRCWVRFTDFWGTRCDLHEKTKLRFDSEGIRFAYPQLDLHFDSDSPFMARLGNSTAADPETGAELEPEDEEMPS
jgi:small conductance mechanosensitive channel